MKIHREMIGTTTGHIKQPPTAVDAYMLDTGKGFAITVWTYGATLIEVLVPDRNNSVNNVVVRLPDLGSYESRTVNPSYVGATLGRYARCIAHGHLRINEYAYQLDCNDGLHHIHGGPIGFDQFVWEANAEQKSDHLSLHLYLHSPNGDQGYPGALSAETIYRVHSDGRLTFEYRATTTASTVVALTNHSYWNLTGSGTVNNHQLTLNTTHTLMVDDELIPIGSPVDISGTHLDYSTAQPLLESKLDHCFVLDDPTWAAKLFDPTSGRVIRIITDQPGLQIYSADGFTRPRAGLCLQTGAWPDSPNHSDYPSSQLDPGNIYHHHSTYEFSVE